MSQPGHSKNTTELTLDLASGRKQRPALPLGAYSLPASRDTEREGGQLMLPLEGGQVVSMHEAGWCDTKGVSHPCCGPAVTFLSTAALPFPSGNVDPVVTSPDFPGEGGKKFWILFLGNFLIFKCEPLIQKSFSPTQVKWNPSAGQVRTPAWPSAISGLECHCGPLLAG